ncbi:phosphotransferase [Streptomyces pinistramenti]|uniref:phosphotransferase n=1 Tax=Streptomyces pinistramenti TaxID=2884812 RepID=UPI001D0772AB|nr:phosphotransferase [Streptomyces pinistramenti]MCB5911978.1 aminoglycoside phosphotransferase family protein [Streptomyces pinistramenti]
MTALAPLHGGFENAELQHVLDRACSAVDLDPTGAQLLRGHTNAVVLLASAPIVVKIARRGTDFAEVQRTAAYVKWLMKRGFPTVPLHPIEQPIDIFGHAVTYWTYLPQPSRLITAAEIAKPLHELHSLPLPPFAMPELDNVTAIRASIDSIVALSEATKRFLIHRVDRLEQDLGEVEYALAASVVQGDPQHRNALLDDVHGAVLCDWDTVAVGQPEWDLVTLEIHCRRFGYKESHYREFSTVYGFDVTAWSGYSVLMEIRELRMITTNARKIPQAPASEGEVMQRIEGLCDGDVSRRWNIL